MRTVVFSALVWVCACTSDKGHELNQVDLQDNGSAAGSGADGSIGGEAGTDGTDDTDDTDDTDSGGLGGADVDADGDGFAASEDCNDELDTVYPGAAEYCDGIDNDCDADIDEDPVDGDTYYSDVDGDGYGDPDTETALCSETSGFVDNAEDCNDALGSVNPGQIEICNTGLDEDCDGTANGCGLSGTVSVRTADVVITSAYAYGGMGRVLDGIGDHDGDGIDDLLIDIGDDEFGTHALDELGGWYLFEGPLSAGTYTSEEADLVVGAGQRTGSPMLSWCGDIDGDGYEDVMLNRLDIDGSGKTVVAYGPLDSTELTDLGPALTSSEHGVQYIDCGGDLDGDGFNDDLLMAVPSLRSSNFNGEAFALAGPISADSTLEDASMSRVEGKSGSRMGSGARILGDVDGDGFDDIFVGEPFANDYAGIGYLQYGPITSDFDAATADVVITKDSITWGIGSVALGADINDDGFVDLLLHNQNPSEGSSDILVFLGPVAMGEHDIEDADFRIEGGPTTSATFGSRMTSGDINGDGVADLLVGDIENNAVATRAGAAFVFYGPIRSDTTSADADFVMQGSGDTAYAGSALATAGDLNGDGREDIVVGESGNGTGGYLAGAVYVFFGEGL